MGSPQDPRLPEVLLTVPHALCPPRYVEPPAHPCDWTAWDSALLLAAALEATGDVVPVLAPADVPRFVCDLNRARCRDTPYRRRVRRHLRERRGVATLVLDVHSFPAEYEGFGDVPLAVLDDVGRGARRPSALGASLARWMDDAGVPMNLLPGVYNDIQDEARYSLGVPALLLEFNEGIAGTAYARRIAREIAAWAAALLGDRPLRPPTRRSSDGDDDDKGR